MPLSKLSVIDTQDIAEGHPIMETKAGRSYCMKVDDELLEDSARATIMVPDSKGVYRSGMAPEAAEP